MSMQLNEKGQALSTLQGTVLGIVSTVAVLGVGYAVVSGLRDSQTSGTEAYNAINGAFTLLDTVKDNLGLIITIAVFTVVLIGIAAFGALRRE